MEKFAIILKLLPAIKDAFLGGMKLSFYLKRNKAITLLLIALTITAFGFFYLFEQAIMHGHNSKKLADKVAASVNVNTNK